MALHDFWIDIVIFPNPRTYVYETPQIGKSASATVAIFARVFLL
jgi:hypothetical protein